MSLRFVVCKKGVEFAGGVDEGDFVVTHVNLSPISGAERIPGLRLRNRVSRYDPTMVESRMPGMERIRECRGCSSVDSRPRCRMLGEENLNERLVVKPVETKKKPWQR